MQVNMLRIVVAASVALLTVGACAHRGPTSPEAQFRLVNGQWFDGKAFVRRDMTVADGQLRDGAVRGGEVIDLGGGFVVPPFCEAHNHNLPALRREGSLATIARYRKDGIFYVQITGALTADASARSGLFNRPDSIDVSFAFTSLTATGGHPTLLIRDLLIPMGELPGETLESLKGRRYFIIDDAADLDRQWQSILDQHPDLIKAFLVDSDNYAKLRDVDVPRGQKGLNPALAPEIVRRAHAAGLQAVFHVRTAADFRVALAAGADQIAHFPGLISAEDVPDADFQTAARRGTAIHTTVVAGAGAGPPLPPAEDLRRREALKESLMRAQRLGVNLVAGSDLANANSRVEIQALRQFGIFSNAELLAMWGQRCAQAVFPKRRVGRLDDGFEASFLVLQGDPLADFENTGRIVRAMKDGRWLE
jgi:imidazolonepropionase-like amidohydrolase